MNSLGKSVVISVIEAATLLIWFNLATAEAGFVAIAVLAVGMIVEHIASLRLNDVPLKVVPIVLLSTVETATWAGWLALGASTPLAIAVLLGGLYVGHILELNATRGWPLERNVGARARDALDITLVEALVGAALLLVGARIWRVVAVFALLVLEHYLSDQKELA